MKFKKNQIAVAALLALAGCGRKAPEPVVPKAAAPKVVEKEPESALPKMKFVDVTAQSGISFIHENGFQGEKLLPETMGSGVAVLDFDNDGLSDLFFVNSCTWPEAGIDPKKPEKPETLPQRTGQPAKTQKLYRNAGKDRKSVV